MIEWHEKRASARIKMVPKEKKEKKDADEFDGKKCQHLEDLVQNSISRLFKVFGSYLPTTAFIQTKNGKRISLEYDTFH